MGLREHIGCEATCPGCLFRARKEILKTVEEHIEKIVDIRQLESFNVANAFSVRDLSEWSREMRRLTFSSMRQETAAQQCTERVSYFHESQLTDTLKLVPVELRNLLDNLLGGDYLKLLGVVAVFLKSIENKNTATTPKSFK